ncbi:ribosomal protein L7/L12 [Nannocystaceae bacterium ST9]
MNGMNDMTYSLRYLGGNQKIAAIKLMRELTGRGLKECKDIVEQQWVFAQGLDEAAARAIVERFEREAGSAVGLVEEDELRHAFDPRHPRRGDQPIERLRWHGLRLAWERREADEWIREREVEFVEIDERDRAIADELEAWAARGLESSARELDVALRCSAREPALEQAIRVGDPPDEAMEVHADWLQRQGDPRGLIAALDLARARASEPGERERLDRAFHEALVEHRRHLFGPHAETLDMLRLDWSGGLVQRLGFDPRLSAGRTWRHGTREWIAGLLELPIVACLRALELGRGITDRETLEAIMAADPDLLAGLRELESFVHATAELFTAERLPRLERLRMVCANESSSLRLPRLRELDLTAWRPDLATELLRESELPGLRVFELRLDDDVFEHAPVDALAALLGLPIVASLDRFALFSDAFGRHVGRLGEGDWPGEVARVLIDSRTLQSVASVDLRGVAFEPDAHALLVEHVRRNPHWSLDVV